jgi:hypothetical protein
MGNIVRAPGVPQLGIPLVREMEGRHGEDKKLWRESAQSPSECGNRSLIGGTVSDQTVMYGYWSSVT